MSRCRRMRVDCLFSNLHVANNNLYHAGAEVPGFFAKALGLEPRRVGAGVRNRSDKDILLSSQNVNYSSFYRHIGLREASINTALSLTVQLNF